MTLKKCIKNGIYISQIWKAGSSRKGQTNQLFSEGYFTVPLFWHMGRTNNLSWVYFKCV